ncbi:hypothetical protein E5S69_10530 [Cupriavidus necator]|uniref:hypothetical protein n=1 Tax=Cupriavidus necator TaxID=106590 RepID=UPI00148F78BE|nr:hypothetical protein [Cupriavidus necator]NOV23951.1 hypothetical protein [Cupriavidus necator]
MNRATATARQQAAIANYDAARSVDAARARTNAANIRMPAELDDLLLAASQAEVSWWSHKITHCLAFTLCERGGAIRIGGGNGQLKYI